MDFVDQAKQQWQHEAETAKEDAKHQELLTTIVEGQATVARMIAGLATVIKKHQPKVTVKHPITTVNTPDVRPVVDELRELVKLERAEKEPVAAPVVEAINALIPVLEKIPLAIDMPEVPEEVTVSNLGELKSALEAILHTLQTTKEPETITIPAPEVTVAAPDLTPIVTSFNEGLARVEAAIKAIPTPVDDDSQVIEALGGVQSQIAGIRFPIPNFITDPLVKFKSADEDANNPVQYFGMVDNMGGWVILKRDTSGSVTTDRYAAGSGAYPTNWTNRSSLTYDYLYQAING